MTQNIYGLIADGGDGSASMRWFCVEPDMEYLDEHSPETWGMNEGSPVVLNFPDNVDLELAGFSFDDWDELVAEYEDKYQLSEDMEDE